MTEKSEKLKMIGGELYRPNDPELLRERRHAKELCRRYNLSPANPGNPVLAELFGHATDAYLEPPFFCDYGFNIKLGRGVYANHNLVVLDCALVEIGNGVLFGPNVVLSAATHPTNAAERASGQEFARPIIIGENAWIGANVTVLPGVTIGANTVVGAGSVVTKSLPASCVAVGNPCRVVRKLESEG